MSSDKQSHLVAVDGGGATSHPPALSAGELTDALGVGTSLLIGRYCVDLASGSCRWSDEVYTMHGWKRDEVEPCLEVLRSRKHPDDRARLVRSVADALRAGRPFACAHRVVGKDGRTRSLVVTGHGRRSPGAGLREVVGYVLDVTPYQEEALQRRAEWVVKHAFVDRSVVEQAKGVIGAVQGVDDAAAERALHDAARAAGVSPHEAAEQVMAALRADRTSTGVTVAAVARALRSVAPVDRPRGHDPLLTRRPRR